MKKIFIIFLIMFFLAPTVLASQKDEAAIPVGSGYVGTLPNLEERFKQSETKESEPTFEYKDGFNDPDEIKPAPRENPAFVNIIMKKDKTSQYINDLNSLVLIIEKLQNIVESENSVQKYNAQAYFLKMNVEFFRDKYKNKSEQSYISFKKVMQLNTHVQSLAQLRVESEVYSPYVTADQSGNTFSQNNIDNQMNYLLTDIKQTLTVLKQTK